MPKGSSVNSHDFETGAGEFITSRMSILFTVLLHRIFVPSSRNTLADILLGKASPLKRPPRRSVSASPTKGKAHTPNDAAQDLVLTARHASSRKSSPLKQTRKALTSKADDAKVKTPGMYPSSPMLTIFSH